RPGALRAPLERVVVHALRGQRVVAVALDLVAQRPHHLRMAGVAALADVDGAAGELERRVGAHALHLLDRALQVEERRDLPDAADGDDEKDPDDEKDRVLLEKLMAIPEGHWLTPPAAARAAARLPPLPQLRRRAPSSTD